MEQTWQNYTFKHHLPSGNPKFRFTNFPFKPIARMFGSPYFWANPWSSQIILLIIAPQIFILIYIPIFAAAITMIYTQPYVYMYTYIYLYVTIVHVLLLDHLVVKQHSILCCVQYILYLTMATSLISLGHLWQVAAVAPSRQEGECRSVLIMVNGMMLLLLLLMMMLLLLLFVVVVSYCCFYLFQERMMAKTSEDLVPVSIILEGLLHALRSAPEAGSSLFGCSGGDCSTVNLCLLWGWHVGSRRSELISFKSWGQIWVWAKNGSAKPPNYGILWNTMEYPAIKPHLNPKMDGFRSNMTNLCLGRSPFCLHPCVCGSDPAGCAHTPRHDAFAACAGAGRMRCRDDV